MVRLDTASVFPIAILKLSCSNTDLYTFVRKHQIFVIENVPEFFMTCETLLSINVQEPKANNFSLPKSMKQGTQYAQAQAKNHA